MSVAVFNTRAFVKRLTAAGMPEAQAEVLADEQMRLIDDRLATKEDIAKLGAEIAKLETATKADIAKLGAEIARSEAATKADIALLKHELTIRLGGMVMALGGFLVAIRFLGR